MEASSFWEPIIIVGCASFAAGVLWWHAKYPEAWPPLDKIPSPSARLWYRRALLAFALSMGAGSIVRGALYFGVISEAVGTIAGALLAIPFFAGCGPLIWYRFKHGF
jgi:hypothetical protein